MLTARAVLALAALTGIALELGVHAASGRREAWDSPVFWTVGLPIAMVVSTLVGWCSRGRAWIGTLAVAPSQVATLMVRSGDIGSLWPLTLVLSAMLSAPFVFAAFVGSRIRREPTRAA